MYSPHPLINDYLTMKLRMINKPWAHSPISIKYILRLQIGLHLNILFGIIPLVKSILQVKQLQC